MRTAAVVSVYEYLHNVYEPDCDYVDGELEDRNVGEKGHALLQGLVCAHLIGKRKELGL